MIWRILKFMQHQFYLRYRHGHGIHSPYLFDFVNEVVFNSGKIDVPEVIKKEHRSLMKNRSMISSGTLGANPASDKSVKRTIHSFVKGSSVSENYGALLFRITRWFKPEVIIELGTGLGVSTIYLASGYPEASLHTLEGIHERSARAAELICRCGLEQISIHRGDLDPGLEELLLKMDGRTDFEGRFVAFVDANHRYEPTLEYLDLLLERTGEEAVIILDDIYWSRGMNRAWKEVIQWPEVRISIDLFHMGILLLRKDLIKADLKINL